MCSPPGTREKTAKRGYDAKHQAERQKWKQRVAAGAVKCARCDEVIHSSQPWDLGHNDDRSAWTGPEHAYCNRSAGAVNANRTRHDEHRIPGGEAPESESRLVARIRADLEAVGHLDTPKGLLAILLAESIAAGGHTASGLAALAGRLEVTLDGVFAGTTVAADPMDELTARRVSHVVAAG